MSLQPVDPSTIVPEYTVGDTLPALSGACYDGSGQTINWTGATGAVHVRRPDRTIITRTVALDSTGKWRMDWQVGDLNRQGTYLVEVQVTFSQGGIQTFGSSPIEVKPQLA